MYPLGNCEWYLCRIYVPAVLSPKIATAGRIGTTIIWSKVAAHRGKDAKTAFDEVFSFSHQFPDALVIIVSSPENIQRF